MAILAFQKPEKVIMLESTSSFGRFEFRPLEPGFGMTVGNALRRILLSSLEGYAITTVKVSGVDHEFAAIPGVMEGMLEIILNLKQVRFIKTVENVDSEKVTVNVAGQTELTAGYHTEYSGMHFGFFYLAEYLNLFIVAGVATTLFLGGWMPLHIAGWDSFNAVMDFLPSPVWFFLKVAVVIFIIMWFKWTFPRLRIDQLLRLEWKYLVPINLLNLLLMVVIVVSGFHF